MWSSCETCCKKENCKSILKKINEEEAATIKDDLRQLHDLIHGNDEGFDDLGTVDRSIQMLQEIRDILKEASKRS
jgi:hypothetical protein